jgi:hypothetical protein
VVIHKLHAQACASKEVPVPFNTCQRSFLDQKILILLARLLQLNLKMLKIVSQYDFFMSIFIILSLFSYYL